MDLQLTDRVVVVTGGTAGLGLATARVLVAEGARVVVSSRSRERVEAAVTALGGASHATGVVADNADPATANRLVGTAQDTFGRLDAALVLVLSSTVKTPIAALGISNGLRPGLAMVVKSAADELGPRGLRVNGVMPGLVLTDRVRQTQPDETQREESARGIPLRRIGEPDELGRVAAFLLSPAASYVSGAVVPVDGGALRAL